MAQTAISGNFMEYARDLAKAEKELGIEHRVHISFEYRTADRERVILHKLDLPREMLDRWWWVIEWRKSKLICLYPRMGVQVYYSYYDKRSGLETCFGSLLAKLSSAKAQVTRVKRAIVEYTEFNTHNNLFFNADTDEQLIKAQAKLKQKISNVHKMELQLQQETERSREAWI